MTIALLLLSAGVKQRHVSRPIGRENRLKSRKNFIARPNNLWINGRLFKRHSIRSKLPNHLSREAIRHLALTIIFGDRVTGQIAEITGCKADLE